nr:N-6 DNA methylase [Pleurocapsa sp. CCALA 161]
MFHRSRLPDDMEDANKCLLEDYHQLTLQQGGRVRDKLRDGVESAIERLANGFLQHPKNEALRQRVASGEIVATEYYRQLLMLIYRLLFLMVAESRDLLLNDNETDLEQRRIYEAYYSVERLRRLAESPNLRREGFQDLWRGLMVTFQLFDEHWRGQALGLSPLNGDLFGSKALSYIDGYVIDNYDLLTAIKNLSRYDHVSAKGQAAQSRRVNYESLDVEELGSIYESLLDFHPQISVKNAGYEFELVKGSDRKSTGSYYTPPELVAQLIKTALEPVMADKLAGLSSIEDRKQAILSITVCDPSCGSGHFLLAAARRLGKELARVLIEENEALRSTQGSENIPELFAKDALPLAVRDVIQHCIYGVDLNPLAIDLCKVALWIEGHNKDHPLSFLDHRIKCGNSLVGVMDLDCLKEGIPEGAYTAVTGDNKAVATKLKKRNKEECKQLGQQNLFDTPVIQAERDRYTQNASEIGLTSENTASDVRAKLERYQASRRDSTWYRDYTLCNLWTAAFFMPMVSDLLPTTETLDRLMSIPPSPALREIADTVNKLAVEKFFFHWCLEFPEVFQDGGFSCILGNPPWERIKLQEKEFFAARDAEIANAQNKAVRERLIKQLPLNNPELLEEFELAKYDATAQGRFVRGSSRFTLTAVGDINTYSIFSETARKLISPDGRAGIIVPTGIATDDTCKKFFGDLVKSQSLVALMDFENREALFVGVHRSYKFSLLSLSNQTTTETQFSFFLTHPRQLEDKQRVFTLTPQDIALINPNTLTSPVFRTRADAELTRKIYQSVPVLENERTGVNPWDISFMTMFHKSNDSDLFKSEEQLLSSGFNLEEGKYTRENQLYVPMYEGRMVHQFDHLYASYSSSQGDYIKNDRSLSSKVKTQYWTPQKDVDNRMESRDWSQSWFFGIRRVTCNTNERTVIGSVIPNTAVTYGLYLIFSKQSPIKYVALISNFNSIVFDYLCRNKTSQPSLTFGVLRQLPIIPPESYTPQDIEFISSRVLELVYTAWDMQPFAQDIWEESGIGSRESIIRQWEAGNGKSHNSILSGSAGLGRGNEIGTDVLSNHQNLPQGGDVRNDFTDPQSSSLSTSEHSRGLRAGESGRIHSISENSPRIAQGSRDSSDIVSQSEFDYRTDCGTSSQAMRNSGQNVAFSDSDNAEQEIKNRESVMGYGNRESGIEESNKNDSRLTTHDSRTNEEQIPIPPFTWNPEGRALLRAELDAKYAKLYGLTRDELRYILDPSDVYGAEFPSETFRVLKNKELKEHGEYRTQRLVLAAWDLLESWGQMPSEA